MIGKIQGFLTRLSPEQRLKLEIANRCGPVLKGVKAANLMAVSAGGWQKVCRALEDSPIICRLLYGDGERDMVFLYRSDLLEQHIKQEAVRGFLLSCGYESVGLDGILNGLSRRYQRFAGAGDPFPHELGVLLQYPLEDVKGFMVHGGRDWLVSGYWKVYGNVREAKQTFAVYDRARLQAVMEVLSGRPLSQVADCPLSISSFL